MALAAFPARWRFSVDQVDEGAVAEGGGCRPPRRCCQHTRRHRDVGEVQSPDMAGMGVEARLRGGQRHGGFRPHGRGVHPAGGKLEPRRGVERDRGLAFGEAYERGGLRVRGSALAVAQQRVDDEDRRPPRPRRPRSVRARRGAGGSPAGRTWRILPAEDGAGSPRRPRRPRAGGGRLPARPRRCHRCRPGRGPAAPSPCRRAGGGRGRRGCDRHSPSSGAGSRRSRRP